MPGGKVHGGGGHGKFARKQQQKYAHEEAVKEKLKRKKEARDRKKERLNSEFLEVVVPGLRQKAIDAIKIINQKISLKQVSRPNAIKIFLALDEWYLEKINQEAIKRRIIEKPFEAQELNKVSLIGAQKRSEYLASLLGNNPSVYTQKEIMRDIEKWKNRIPKILEGKY